MQYVYIVNIRAVTVETTHWSVFVLILLLVCRKSCPEVSFLVLCLTCQELAPAESVVRINFLFLGWGVRGPGLRVQTQIYPRLVWCQAQCRLCFQAAEMAIPVRLKCYLHLAVRSFELEQLSRPDKPRLTTGRCPSDIKLSSVMTESMKRLSTQVQMELHCVFFCVFKMGTSVLILNCVTGICRYESKPTGKYENMKAEQQKALSTLCISFAHDGRSNCSAHLSGVDFEFAQLKWRHACCTRVSSCHQ